MILLLPGAAVPADTDRPQGPHPPWWTPVLAGAMALLFLGERFLLHLPPALQQVVASATHGRLYPDPGQRLFDVTQTWSHVLLHGSWWHVAACLVAWIAVAGALERRVGPVGVLLVLLILTPLTTSVHLVLGQPVPDIGLSASIPAMTGVLLGIVPRARLRLAFFYAPLVVVGRFATHLPLLAFATLFMAQDLARVLVCRSADPGLVPPGFALANLVTQVLALGAGLAFGLSLGLRTVRRHTAILQPDDLAALAAGRIELDELERVLFQADDLPLPVLERIADRCVAEDRPDAARVLATYLALRDPDCRAYARLRAYLAG